MVTVDNNLNVLTATELFVRLKMVEMVYLMLCVFYRNVLKSVVFLITNNSQLENVRGKGTYSQEQQNPYYNPERNHRLCIVLQSRLVQEQANK